MDRRRATLDWCQATLAQTWLSSRPLRWRLANKPARCSPGCLQVRCATASSTLARVSHPLRLQETQNFQNGDSTDHVDAQTSRSKFWNSSDAQIEARTRGRCSETGSGPSLAGPRVCIHDQPWPREQIALLPRRARCCNEVLDSCGTKTFSAPEVQCVHVFFRNEYGLGKTYYRRKPVGAD